jgi:hypothetical protein
MVVSFQGNSMREIGTMVLREVFGGNYPVLIEAVGPYVRIVLCLPHGWAGDAEMSLRTFDYAWFLKHCHRLTDTVYDYQCDNHI